MRLHPARRWGTERATRLEPVEIRLAIPAADPPDHR